MTVRKYLAVTVTAVIGMLAANVAAFALLQGVFPWMHFLPEKDAAPAPTKTAPPAMKVTAAEATPAARVAEQVIGTRSASLTARWKESAAQPGIPGMPYAFDCGTEPGAAPVLGRNTGWVLSTGPLPTDVKASVNVSVRVYGAGQGAAAFKAIGEHAYECGSAARYDTAGLGVEAMTVRAKTSSAMVWRRGDVLIVASVRGASPTSLQQAWADYDRALESALHDTCVNPDSTIAEAARSPWGDRKTYTGLGVPRKVEAPTSTPLPLPVGVTPVAIPAPEVTVDDDPGRATAPAAPITPDALPAQVTRPEAPAAPVQPPAFLDVMEQVADLIGPGCGWDFTAQTVPVFDEATASAAFSDATAAATQTLTRKWAKWEVDKIAYYRAYATFVKAAADFNAYAAQVRDITTIWANVQEARTLYETAKQTYLDAVRARREFILAQRQATADYNALLEQCANQPTIPEETEGPGQPTATPTTPAEPQTENPAFRAGTIDPAFCPPIRPVILDEQAPPVPTRPTAPDASFPEYRNPAHMLTDPEVDAAVGIVLG